MIRPAKFADIMALMPIFEDAHKRSVYADRCGISKPHLRGILQGAIGAHGRTNAGAACCFIWEEVLPPETQPKPTALIIGAANPVYNIGDKLMTQDLFLVGYKRASPKALSALVDAYVGWAESIPDCIEINLSASDAIMPTERIEKLYTRKKFRRNGALFMRWLKGDNNV